MVWTCVGCFCSDFWSWHCPRTPNVSFEVSLSTQIGIIQTLSFVDSLFTHTYILYRLVGHGGQTTHLAECLRYCHKVPLITAVKN